MPPRAVLIGLPAAGKSTVGARLAQQLGVRFADSDQLVTRSSGRSVSEIFATDGEAAFRELEADAIRRALTDFDGILALGGGAITTAAVRQALAEADVVVVLLTAPQSELLKRIGHGRPRPLLTGDPAGRLAELARDRASLYQQVATLTVESAGRPVQAVAAAIRAQLASVPRGSG